MSDQRIAGNFRIGRFVLQPAERQLLAEGKVVPLEPRAFDLLSMLVERAGQLVSKDELFERIWPGKIVEEGNLHVQISVLRKALGPDSIATVVGHGYRFVSEVTRTGAGSPPPPPNRYNLPRPFESFIGREDELVLLTQTLRESRLVTLTGIGGCGKTRLAIKLAERVLGSFADGVRFVDLADVGEPDRVALAVATAAGVREEADSPIEETLSRQLAQQHMLLILDNCEDLLATCSALVSRMLAAPSCLRIVVTSRERLGIVGESIVQVRPLTLPSGESGAEPDSLDAFEAVRLFVERARHVAPEFGLNAGNAAAVIEICRRLDGIPLAIELAAARVMLLSVEQIRARLDARFRLLSGNSRAVSRHQTLLATMQSSYESLGPEEQQCMRRLSVFAGGCALDAVATVAGQADDIEVLDQLRSLVEKSLVQVDRFTTDAPRYRMLETVRQFARERLGEAAASGDIHQRHLAHFLAFAKTAQANLFGPAMRQWLERVDAELPNLLAAHAWCDRAVDGAIQGLELAANMRTYWLARGLFALGQQIYDEALARPGAHPRGMARGKALHAMGQHQYVRGGLRESLEPMQAALEIAREHGDDEWAVYCLDRITLASAWLGDTAHARECCDEELVVAQRTGNQRLVGFATTARGAVCRAEGNFQAAAEAYEQALPLFGGAQDLNNRHNVLVDIARVSVALGAFARARETLVAAIVLIGEMGAMYRGHYALDAASRLAAAAEDWQTAARFQGASDAAVDKMGGTRTWFDDAVLASLREKPRAVLGATIYASIYDLGRGLALDAALEEALAWLKGG
ncbi:MAG: winged helix-turn-helix domain-containing protein [Betaproteobacteria bacterium]